METVHWKVDGMSCTNCALTIHKYLEEQGLKDVKVNFIGGDVSFETPDVQKLPGIEQGIQQLGYKVVNENSASSKKKQKFLSNHFQRFVFCFIFSFPLFLHMFGLHVPLFMNAYFQLALTLPVFCVGIYFFGRSAYKSLKHGIPNMDVLITIGALASFCYSLYGTLTAQPQQYMFYETTATIITLVFFGNWLEHRSVMATQASLNKLAKNQKVMANMIAYDEAHNEHIFPVENTQLKVGDLILIRSGEQVPIDCKILSGSASVNESILTGESIPVEKSMNDVLIGGSIIANGTIKAMVTTETANTVMSQILKMVKDAQSEKPPVQQLADKISAIFVPVVVGIALVTFIGNYFIAHIGIEQSLLRGIAVLVISCPCAMGLATPAAIAVGLGRAARNGILFRNARSLEVFKNIQQVVFDKTGTLTTGAFHIKAFETSLAEDEFKMLVFSLEKYSNHPIAKSITKEWKQKNFIRWKNVQEIKGMGIQAEDKEGNIYKAGSGVFILPETKVLENKETHNVFIIKNEKLVGWIDVQDEIRAEAKSVVALLHHNNIKTVLLSGDTYAHCKTVAEQLGIQTVLCEQTPEQKLQTVAKLSAEKPTAMVGDGINDAPALAKATVGISISEASQIALQSAQVILMNGGLKNLPLALSLGKQTYHTIQQNLFWAFAYNIVAIPVAAFGYLNPSFSALAMGFSDVVLAINSLRLNWKKLLS
jgi:Cu+-exporting ATPase